MSLSATVSGVGGALQRATGKAFTMAVINPWAYHVAAEAQTEIAIQVAKKAAVYLASTLEQYIRRATPGGRNPALVTELTRQAFDLAEVAIARGMASQIQKYFLFRLNPSKLDKSFAKIRDNKLTGAGPIMDTYGNQLITYSYSGTMGNMRPAVSFLRMPQLSPAWHYLQLFEEFFLRHHEDLIFVLDNEVVIGRFDSFKYGLNADQPWLVNYNFQVSVYPETKFSLLTGGVGQAFLAIKPGMMRNPFVGANDTSSAIDVFDDTLGHQRARELARQGI